MTTTTHDVVVVGAGLSGLALARALEGKGQRVLLLEESRGVGGRCATRRVQQQHSVDHGLPLLHGQRGRFLHTVRDALPPQELLRGWPGQPKGRGTPCQPQGYQSHSKRWAITSGINSFPKALASGLTITRETRVTGLELTAGGVDVATAAGTAFGARTVVLTCPPAQTLELLDPLAASDRELQAAAALLRRMHLLPCLTVMAGYSRPAATDWQLRLAEQGPIHALINESSKRGRPEQSLVIQARPDYSRAHLDEEPTRWVEALLAATAQELGPWAADPTWRDHHCWRHARLPRGDELSGPLLLRREHNRIGICGEAFNPLGGAEGAFLSGQILAQRIIDEDS